MLGLLGYRPTFPGFLNPGLTCQALGQIGPSDDFACCLFLIFPVSAVTNVFFLA